MLLCFYVLGSETYNIFICVLQVVEKVDNMKPIEINTSGRAEFEFDMKLNDPNSKIFVYKVSSTAYQRNKNPLLLT